MLVGIQIDLKQYKHQIELGVAAKGEALEMNAVMDAGLNIYRWMQYISLPEILMSIKF